MYSFFLYSCTRFGVTRKESEAALSQSEMKSIGGGVRSAVIPSGIPRYRHCVSIPAVSNLKTTSLNRKQTCTRAFSIMITKILLRIVAIGTAWFFP